MGTHGSYRFSSDVIQVSAAWEDYVSRKNGLELTEKTIAALAIDAHERKHHEDSTRTPFGLLLWRLDLSICTDAQYLCRHYGFPGGYRSVQAVVPRPTNLLLPRGLDRARRCAMQVGDDLRRLIAFRHLILNGGAPGLTIGEALSVANAGLSVLRARFDLPSTWHFITHLPVGLLWAPETDVLHRVTGRDVLERSATGHERLVVQELNNEYHAVKTPSGDREIVTSWLDWRDALTRYKDVGGFEQAGSDLRDVMACAEWSLEGPCDPALTSTEDIPIESALPSWRWAVLAGVLIPSTCGPNVFDNWATRGTLDTYSNLAHSSLNGEHGIFADAKLKGVEREASNPLSSYNAFVLQRYHDSFSIRSSSSGANELPTASLVTVFADTCRVASASVEEASSAPDFKVGSDRIESLMIVFAVQESAKHCAYGEPLNVAEMIRVLYLMQLRVHSLRDEKIVDVVNPIFAILHFLDSEHLIGAADLLAATNYLSRLFLGSVQHSEMNHQELIAWALAGSEPLFIPDPPPWRKDNDGTNR